MNSISENIFVGYILEADFEYPDNLHNDYPLAPEKIEISQSMLLKYGIKIGGVNKLVPNLRNKKYMLFITEIFNCIYH